MQSTRLTLTSSILTLLASAGLAQGADTAAKVQFEPPVQLQAEGAVIDTGEDIAHSGPLVTDFDGDGKLDLLVGTFRGTIRVYKNVGTNQKPSYESKGNAKAEGEEIRIHNW